MFWPVWPAISTISLWKVVVWLKVIPPTPESSITISLFTPISRLVPFSWYIICWPWDCISTTSPATPVVWKNKLTVAAVPSPMYKSPVKGFPFPATKGR